MRYEKADNLLQLALEMQAARGGLSLADIQEKFGVGRRTAMRISSDTLTRPIKAPSLKDSKIGQIMCSLNRSYHLLATDRQEAPGLILQIGKK